MNRLYTLAIAILLFHSGGYAQGWEAINSSNSFFKSMFHHGIKSLWYDKGTLYAGGTFASVGNRLVKWNGVSWEEFGGSPEPRVVCVDREHNFYTPQMDNSSRSYVKKWDGALWSELGTGSQALNLFKEIFAICADKDGNIYAAGSSNDTGGYFNVAKWDGTSWTQLGMDTNALNANGRIWTLKADSRGNIYAAGDFTQGGYTYVAKWDGAVWGQLGPGANPTRIYTDGSGTTPYIYCMYIDAADNIYAAAGVWYAYSFVTKWDGSSWQDVGSRTKPNNGNTSLNLRPAFAGNIDAITGDNAGNIYIAGEGVEDSATNRNCVMKWNGTRWVGLGSGKSSLNANAPVWAICADTSGILYAGGEFTNYARGDEGYNYVAKFNTLDTAMHIAGIQPIIAWPNPANDLLFVKGSEFNEYIYMFDISGAVKMKILNSIAPSGAIPAIDISTLAPGAYFLRSKNCIPCVFNKN